MAESSSEKSPSKANTPRSTSVVSTIGRRKLLAGMSVALASGLVLANPVGRPVYRNIKRAEAKDDVNDLLYSLVHQAHKLTIIPDLLQLDPLIPVSDAIFKSPRETMQREAGQLIAAHRPYAVKKTILRNVADYSAGIQDSVARVLPDIPDGLLAFYEPGPGRFVYLDAGEHYGEVIPLTTKYVPGDRLITQDIEIDGREVRGVDTSYPYLLDLRNNDEEYRKTHEPYDMDPQAVYRFIGHSITANSSADLNTIVLNYTYNISEPIQFPAP